MTVERLRQYRELRREARRLRVQLEGTQRGLAAYEAVPDGADEVVERTRGMLRRQVREQGERLVRRLEKCERQAGEIEAFIDGLEDSLMRQVFSLRYEEGCTWPQVAARTGLYYAPEALRVRHMRYLKGQEEGTHGTAAS